MKKIALVSDGWKKYITYSWVDGLMKAAKEAGLDILTCAFNTNGNLSHDSKHNAGEYNMYTLPKFDMFDGIIFDCTNTTDPQEIKWIVDILKRSGRPVVSISYYVDGFYYVGNDNCTLFKGMIDHLYKDHGFRDMVFAGGPENNYENRERFRAYKEAMEEYGLPFDEGRYMFGDFEFGTGERYIGEWLDAGKKLPEAFVCANDNIAAGICAEAERRGLKVPDDFAVTGFDNLDKAAYYNPQIATVEHNRGNVIKNALHILMDIWEGKEVKPFTYLYSEVIPAESCGCKNNGRVDYRMYGKWQIDWSVEVEKSEDILSEFENNLAECEDFDSIFGRFSDYLEKRDCDGMYIVVDKGLLSAEPSYSFAKSGYDRKRMTVVYACENHERIYSLHTVTDLNTRALTYGAGSSFVFFPIHFRDDVVGFTVLINPNFLYSSPFFYNVHSVFITKLESMYKQLQLANAVNRMKDLYNRDSLTGLYNRVAYNEMVAPKFEDYKRDNIPCALIFFDVDFFKDINDTLGHDYGDRVLVTIGRILLETKPKDGFAYRFGGDEFIVFFPYATEEKIKGFLEDALEILKAKNINISYGYVISDPKQDTTLDRYIAMADEKMYALKQGRKRTSGRSREELMPIIFEEDNGHKFYRGVDISSLCEKLDNNEKFHDMNGSEKDPFILLEENNINSVRLRIWNDPANFPESKGYCDLEHTVAMARMIKEHDMHFMLDFHYSDYWADPGQQRKPLAWRDMSTDELVGAVYDYTEDVLERLSQAGALPDIVQIGNEIRAGMLFPDGEVPNYGNLAKLVNAGIRAVRDTSSDIKVMIHLDQGGQFYYLREWFDAMQAAGMEEIDAIGISFYSFWHGTYMDLRNSMKQLTETYKLPVYIVETAHPWRQCEGEHISADLMENAGLPAGKEEQKKALQIIMQIAAKINGEYDTGVYYWEPLTIAGKNYGSWDENMGMFDEKGRALPSFEAYRYFNPKKPVIDDIDGYIESLYMAEELNKYEAGSNLISNGDFTKGIEGWQIVKTPESVTAEVRNQDGSEIYVSGDCNYTFVIQKEINIDHPGRYRLCVDYRGTNTTGVHVVLFLRKESSDGEHVYTKNIYPSDVRFTTQYMEDLMLQAGSVQIGIKMETPPVFGRIRNFKLIEVE